MERKLIDPEPCQCDDSSCCQPVRRNRWQRPVLVAIVVLALGIIAYKLWFAPAPEPGCGSSGCCADTAACCDTTRQTDLK